MAVKTFLTYHPSEDQFISMNDSDGNAHQFKLNPSLPGRLILDFMYVSGTDDASKLSQAIQNVIGAAIVDDDKEAWAEFSDNPQNGVTISVLSELVGHITTVLSGNSQGSQEA